MVLESWCPILRCQNTILGSRYPISNDTAILRKKIQTIVLDVLNQPSIVRKWKLFHPSRHTQIYVKVKVGCSWESGDLCHKTGWGWGLTCDLVPTQSNLMITMQFIKQKLLTKKETHLESIKFQRRNTFSCWLFHNHQNVSTFIDRYTKRMPFFCLNLGVVAILGIDLFVLFGSDL